MPIVRLPVAVRFARYFTPGKSNECWNWQGALDKDGYGSILIYSKRNTWGHTSLRAHRFAYQQTKGKIPRGAHVLHSCDNPSCVNPNHLRAGTTQDNRADCVKRRRQALGARNANSKLTDADARAILKDTRRQIDIAAAYGVIQATISRIKRGDGWKHIPRT